MSDSFEAALDGSESTRPLVTREEWDSLLHSSASNVVFLTWQWQYTWWRHFGAENGCRLHLLAIRGEDGALVGLAPLYFSDEPLPPLAAYRRGVPRPVGEGEPARLVRLVGGTEVADYLDVLSLPDRLRDVWAAVLDYLVARRDEWELIDLHSLPEFSPSREVLPSLAAEYGLAADVFPEDVSPLVQLPGDWESYMSSLGKKDRHELRRKVRKLEGRDDVQWHLVSAGHTDEVLQATRIFLDLHRKSDQAKALFMNEHMASFFLDLAQAMADTGWLDLSILEVDHQPVAAYFSFLYEGRVYLYNSGYSPKFASLSAGVALLVYRIHKAIVQGVSVFDFLRGDEPYKYDFGAKNTSVYRAVIASTGSLPERR